MLSAVGRSESDLAPTVLSLNKTREPDIVSHNHVKVAKLENDIAIAEAMTTKLRQDVINSDLRRHAQEEQTNAMKVQYERER